MTAGPATGPTQTASDELQTKTWESHPWVARLARFSIFIFPLAVSIVASLWASRTFPPERVGLNRWVWWLGLAIAAMLLVRILERWLARLTPLTMLFRLSLIFPDQAPSRFSVALKTGSTRSVKRRLAEIQETGTLFSDEDTYSSQMLELVAVLAEHDRMTRGHAERVRAYSELIGAEMGLPEQDLAKLRWSALLHDMGKLHVPHEILNKEGRPTDQEWAILKEHPAKSETYLEPLAEWLGDWRHAAVGHHERWDGNGYPKGQAGTEIPLSARIVAVADAFDVMTSTRSYKKPMPSELARQEVANKAGSQFDPVVSRAFLNIGLGDLRRTAGPLAFFANLPIIRGVPIGSTLSAAATSAASAATAAVAIAVNAVVGIPETAPAPDSIAFVESEPPAVVAAPPAIATPDVAGFEDESIAGSIAIDGDGPFTVTVIENPTQGGVQLSEPTLEQNTNVAYVYTPQANRFGSDSFDVRVCDSDDRCSDTTIEITITPVNDAPLLNPLVISLDEGAALTLPVAISDIDSDQLSLTVIEQPENGVVSIDGQFLTLTHDGSETDRMRFTIELSDGTAVVTRQLVAQVNPVNDAPVANDDSTSTAYEISLQLPTATLLVNDDDDGPTLTVASVAAINGGDVSLVGDVITFTPNPGFTGDALFAYSATDGVLDSEPATVTVTVGSESVPVTTAPVAITVPPPTPNEPPTLSVAPIDIIENSVSGTVVGLASGTDPENGTLVYSITGGTAATAMTIDPTTGEVSVTGPFNFEATPTLSLKVTVTDNNGLSATSATAVTVLNVNEPPVIAATSNLSVTEGSLPSSPITNGTISAADPENDNVTYSIVDLSNTFSINPVTGEITVVGPVDFENSTSYTATVIATDSGSGLQSTLPIEIFVINVNEPPVFVPIASPTLAEDTALGAVVATATAADVEGDALTYAIDGGTGASLFAIDPVTGEITLTSPLDFEALSSYSLVVSVTDDGAPPTTTTTTLTIVVGNVNDAPAIAPGQSVSVAENTTSGIVALGSPIIATDEDGDPLTYSIVDPENLFTIDLTTGEIIRTATPLDHETTPTHPVTVTVTDPDGATGSEVLNIVVIDRNDTPVIVAPAPFAIPENLASTVVGTLVATDQDGDILTWQLTGPGATNFAIDINGEVTLIAPLDFETIEQYNLVATVTDSAVPGAAASTPVTIDVVPVNETPIVPANQIFSILESAAPGAAVDPGPVAASDIDGDAVTFSLSATETTFAIDAATGVLSLITAVDFETLESYSVRVTVEDPGGISYTKTVTIDVIDVNEAPSITPPPMAPVRVLENSPAGTLVTNEITATDPESDQLRFTMFDPSGLFVIHPNTGEITVAVNAIDLEDAALHTVTIVVDDSLSGGTGSDDFTLNIEVVDENEAPQISTLTLPAVPENTAPANVVATLLGTDPEGDPLGWTVIGGTGENVFSLDLLTGELTLDVSVDYDTIPATTGFTIIVTLDDGLLSDTQTITIPISNVDEPPVIDPGQTFTILEDAINGTRVDPDVVSFTDPENDGVTWTINDPTGTFTINATTGHVFLNNAANIDFETLPTIHNLDVTATGSPAASPSTESITITVIDVNESPTLTITGPGDVDEELPAGALVQNITLNITDPDTLGHWYAITGGTGQTLFQIDPSTGDVRTNNVLDFEAGPTSYTLDIKATEVGTPDSFSVTRTVTVNVNDANDAPVVGALQTFSITDGLAIGTPLDGNGGVVIATDIDSSVVDFAIVGGSGQALFAIDSSGQLTTDQILDYNDGQIYELIIEATDNGTPVATGTETVNVTVSSIFGTSPSPDVGKIIFNEVGFTAHAVNNPPTIEDDDFIELYNPTGNAIDISGWILTDRPLGTSEANQLGEPLVPDGVSISGGERVVLWLANTRSDTSVSAGAETTLNGSFPGISESSLQLNDDLFLYDENGLLVAYVAWGDPDAPNSEIGPRPLMTAWNLWDPTHEAALSFTGRQSISLVPDGTNHQLSGCWERTGTGDAAATCPDPTVGVSADTDIDVNRERSPGDSNDRTSGTQFGNNPVISEFAVRGMADNGFGDNNFIELYNNSPFTYDPADMYLEIYDGGTLTGPVLPLTLNSSAWLPGEHWLVGQVSGPYGFPLGSGDGSLAATLDSWDYGFRLMHLDYGLLDMVGSDTSSIREGGGIEETLLTSGPQSFKRRIGRDAGPCQDTDDNAADFTKQGYGITPVNQSAGAFPCVEAIYPTDNSKQLVFNEITTGLGGDDDDFIELFNPSFSPGVPIDLSDHEIYQDNLLVATLNAGTILAPGDTWLLGGASHSGPAEDHGLTKNIESTGMLELRDPFGVVLDQVLFSFQIPGTLGSATSWERADNGCSYSADPATDFEWTSNPTPRASDPATATPCS